MSAVSARELAGQHSPGTRRRPLTCLTLVILIFYNVSGGPFGSEETVAVAGPLLAIVGFIVFPLIWSVPEALVTAELATAFPDDAGYVTWVTAAFGHFWGFQEGVLSWICGSMDSAIYPALFVNYLAYVVCPVEPGADADDVSCPVLDDPLAGFLPSLRTCIVFLAIGALSYMNWRGLELVGKVAIGLTVFSLLPFVAICILGVPRVNPANLLDTRTSRPEDPDRGFDWVTWLNTLFWNLNYWDTASTLAGEVAEPERAFPRALGWAVLLVSTTYVLPLSICVAALPPNQAWASGFFVQAGYLLGGRFLQYWVLASAAVSNVGQFVSEQAANSHQLLGMAQLGYLPVCFNRRSSHGTPTLGLLLGAVLAVPLATFQMDSLVAMLNGVYCLAELLEFAAFLRLRWRYPHMIRPFKVPLGLAGCVALLAAPSAMCVLMLLAPILRPANGEGPAALICTLSSAVFGVVLYAIFERCRKARPDMFVERTNGMGPGLGDEQLAVRAHLPGALLHEEHT